MSRNYVPKVKFFIQRDSIKCPSCKRGVNIVSTDQGPELLWSRHFQQPPGPAPTLSWCEMSGREYA